MEKQDLSVFITIDHDFPLKASHCNTFFYLAQCSSIQDDHIIMGKDAKGKGKGKTRTKRVFKHSGSSADAELVKGLTRWSFFFLLWAVVFLFSLSNNFFLLLIFS